MSESKVFSFFTLFCLVAVFTGGWADPIRPKEAIKPTLVFKKSLTREILQKLGRAEQGNANDYMDEVMALVRQEIVNQGLDRIELPSGNFGFWWDLWPYGNVHGGVDLYDGFMTGMQTIARVGDATLSNDGSIVYFESLCGITHAALGYAIDITFMDIGPHATMTGSLPYAHFYFKARIDLLSAQVVVENFDIKDVGRITTEITGLGIFDWLAEQIANFAINLVKPFIKEIIEGPITDIMNTVIQQYVDSILNKP